MHEECSDTIPYRKRIVEDTMSTFATTATHAPGRVRTKAGSVALRVVLMIEDALERRRSRLALMELTDDQLKDIGVSRSEAFREAHRPFWG